MYGRVEEVASDEVVPSTVVVVVSTVSTVVVVASDEVVPSTVVVVVGWTVVVVSSVVVVSGSVVVVGIVVGVVVGVVDGVVVGTVVGGVLTTRYDQCERSPSQTIPSFADVTMKWVWSLACLTQTSTSYPDSMSAVSFSVSPAPVISMVPHSPVSVWVSSRKWLDQSSPWGQVSPCPPSWPSATRGVRANSKTAVVAAAPRALASLLGCLWVGMWVGSFGRVLSVGHGSREERVV